MQYVLQEKHKNLLMWVPKFLGNDSQWQYYFYCYWEDLEMIELPKQMS